MGLSTKLLSHVDGPYRVIEKQSPLVYTIKNVENPRKRLKVHIRRLRKWNDDPILELDNIVTGRDQTSQS